MTWDDLVKLIILIMGSLGGTSAVMIAVAKWSSDVLFVKLEADIKNKQQKDLAEHKKQLKDSTAKFEALLKNSSYITQHQYDLEMEIYRSAWGALFGLMQCMEWIEGLKPKPTLLHVQDSYIKNERELKADREKKYTDFSVKLSEFERIVDANAPFYQKTSYQIMGDLVTHFQELQAIFYNYKDLIQLVDTSDEERLNKVCGEIRRQKDLLTEEVRNYLQSLKCVS